MIDFKDIAGLIPPQGQVSFTITQGRNGTLIVLVQPLYPAIKDLSAEQKGAYQQARTPMVLTATPDELNEKFSHILQQTQEGENRLHRAFRTKEADIEKAIATTQAGNQAVKEEPKHTELKPSSKDKKSDKDPLDIFQ